MKEEDNEEYKDLQIKAAEDTERFDKEMSEWNKKGFYTKADGTTSKKWIISINNNHSNI